MFRFLAFEAGGHRFTTRYRSAGALNSMDERPLSKIIGFRFAVLVRGICLARNENI